MAGSPYAMHVQSKDNDHIDSLVQRMADKMRVGCGVYLVWAGDPKDVGWLTNDKRLELILRASKLIQTPESSGFGGGGPNVDKDALLTWLRHEASISKEASALIAKGAATAGDPDAWDTSRLMAGQAQAYEDVIKHVRGLSEREFQLAKRKGTL